MRKQIHALYSLIVLILNIMLALFSSGCIKGEDLGKAFVEKLTEGSPAPAASPKTECIPQGIDVPDRSYQDSDCDGIDGAIDQSVFVSTEGANFNPGTMDAPLLTIGAGIEMASRQGRHFVLVDVGMYSETFRLRSGISIFGGYRSADGWARFSDVMPVIEGSTQGTILIENVEGVGLEQLHVLSNRRAGTETDVTAVQIRNSRGVVLLANRIEAGSAFNGIDGGCDLGQRSLGGPGGNSIAVSIDQSSDLAVAFNMLKTGSAGNGGAGVDCGTERGRGGAGGSTVGIYLLNTPAVPMIDTFNLFELGTPGQGGIAQSSIRGTAGKSMILWVVQE